MRHLLSILGALALLASHAVASNLLIDPYRFGGAPVDIVQTDATSSGTSQTTFTFTNQNLGGTTADQYCVAADARAAGSRVLNAVTIDGASATAVAGTINTAGGNSSISAIWCAAATGNATGSVVLQFSNTTLRAGIVVYRLSNAQTTAADNDNSTANDPSVALDVPANGAAIATCFSAASTTATWTGLSEDVDTVMSGGNAYSAASAEFAAAQTGLTITCDWGSNTSPSFAAASWGP